MNNKLRRNVLKGLAVGTPAVWVKPIVDTAVLPAHAQSSAICVAGSINSTTDATEGVVVLFDGESTCSLVLVSGPDGGDSGNADEMLLIDNDLTDDNAESFDLDGPAYGANWSNDGPDVTDQNAGSYSFVRTRQSGINSGVNFRVDFTVSFTQPDTMTVSSVVISLA